MLYKDEFMLDGDVHPTPHQELYETHTQRDACDEARSQRSADDTGDLPYTEE